MDLDSFVLTHKRIFENGNWTCWGDRISLWWTTDLQLTVEAAARYEGLQFSVDELIIPGGLMFLQIAATREIR